jgi:hypothetical protein
MAILFARLCGHVRVTRRPRDAAHRPLLLLYITFVHSIPVRTVSYSPTRPTLQLATLTQSVV